jgi:4-carboxymuconolactone decarboxylase
MTETKTLLDPKERSDRGVATAEQVIGVAFPEPTTLLQESWRDFIFAEVWTRPGALKTGELSLSELREGALHLAVYSGWGNGGKLDRAVTRVQQELGLDPVAWPPIRAEPWDPQVRNDEGEAEFTKVMTFPGGGPTSPFLQGINNFVFGEMWCRRGLDEPSRRWITLVGVCESGADIPIGSHIHSAMASGNCKPGELLEFVLQYGTHAGWPKASRINGIVQQQIAHFEAGKNWMGQ